MASSSGELSSLARLRGCKRKGTLDSKRRRATLTTSVALILVAFSSLASALESDFPPKLIHQPADVQVPVNKPHTIECPIESRPESEVRWFKDDSLLEPQLGHTEQSGKELMFFQITKNDSGAYYCEASNQLGSITSAPFKLAVLSSVYDASIRFEPRVAAVGIDQQVEFNCSIPMQLATVSPASSAARSMSAELGETVSPSDEDEEDTANSPSGQPNVSWRRDGEHLPVRWVVSSALQNNKQQSSARFLARQTAPNEFVLTIARALASDNNATYTCLFDPPPGGSFEAALGSAGASPDQKQASELARESAQVRLFVIRNSEDEKLGKQVSMGPAIDNLPDQRGPNKLDQSNRTTSMSGASGARKVITLGETLRDLYELVRPTLVVLAIVSLVGAVIVLQFLVLRRRARNQNRYMKHHPYNSSASNASSSNASSANGFIGAISRSGGPSFVDQHCVDPVLTSLLNRTLSAPSAVSLSGAGKKYKSYRDHMRKVAAANGNGSQQHNSELINNDFIDASHYFAAAAAAAAAASGNPNHLMSDQQADPFYNLNPQQQQQAQLPNLYNQSLAAREQARSLLQSSEHMRSLNNLTGNHLGRAGANVGLIHTQQQNNSSSASAYGCNNNKGAHPTGSHLDIPMSLSAHVANQQQMNALLPPHLLQSWAAQQRNAQQQLSSMRARGSRAMTTDQESYQLVNCESISPSSTSNSSSASGSNVPETGRMAPPKASGRKPPPPSSMDLSLNHYSTIETNELDDGDRIGAKDVDDNERGNNRLVDDEDEARYEELYDETNDNDDDNEDTRESNLRRERPQGAQVQQVAASSTNSHSNGRQHTSAVINRSNSNQRTSTFVTIDGPKLEQATRHLRSGSGNSNNNNSKNLQNPSSNDSHRNGSQQMQKQPNQHRSQKLTTRNSNRKPVDCHQQEQLSPYAVSSIMQPRPPPPPSQPPPVATSEAMKALNEQFDVGQLILIDEAKTRSTRASMRSSDEPTLFNQLPPPPLSQPPEAN